MNRPVASANRSLWAVLRLPLLVLATTAGGLAAALFGDGAWHWLSWLLLALPLVIILAAARRG